MTTTPELITERHRLAERINELLDQCIDENGVLDINAEKLIELQELQLLNAKNLINKAEAIVFAMKRLESDIETYQETIKQYQSMQRRAKNSLVWLSESLLPQLIDELGNNGKLPTPTFPKLRVRTYGKGRIILNDEFNAPLDSSLFKQRPPTLKDIDKERIEQMIKEGTVPIDDDGNPLAIKTEPVRKATYR